MIFICITQMPRRWRTETTYQPWNRPQTTTLAQTELIRLLRQMRSWKVSCKPKPGFLYTVITKEVFQIIKRNWHFDNQLD